MESNRVGMLIGLLVGSVLAIALWLLIYTIMGKRRIRAQMGEMAGLCTERLKELAADPMSPQVGWAMGELKERGIIVRPSLESVCALLTSAEYARRVRGMTTLFGLYPEVFAKIDKDASSTDSPEVWRARLAAILEGG